MRNQLLEHMGQSLEERASKGLVKTSDACYSGCALRPAEQFANHPHWGYEHMRWVGEEGGRVAFDEVADPRQGEGGRDQKQSHDPVKPDHDQRREADRDGDHVKRAVDGMIVCAVVMGVETHRGKL
jgi:hypothetical protein